MPFYGTNAIVLNPIVGYEHKFRHVTAKIQLNISNVFNHYDVVINPSPVTGYSVPANVTASFYGEPRLYTLTTSIKF